MPRSPHSARDLVVAACLLFAFTFALGGDAVRADDDAPAPGDGQLFALVIGVTDYPAIKARMLARGSSLARYEHTVKLGGCDNDVGLWLDTLTRWKADEVVALRSSGAEAAQPTRKNVLAALDALAAREYRTGDVVLVAYSGHGVQQPDRAVDEEQTLDELDGLDEAWLLADADRHPDRRIGFRNTITDDEIGHRLRTIEAKGALVWLVMDCCHSATGMRGVADEEPTRTRNFDPALIGVEFGAVEEEVTTRGLPGGSGRTSMDGEQDDLGGVVAFYAAQSYQEVPEIWLPRRHGPDARSYGLLTTTVIRALERAGPDLTFGELYEQVVAGYQAFGRHHQVQALAEGDLERRVFDGKPSQGPRLVVRRAANGALSLSAGALHGIGKGTTLDVYAPGARLGDEAATLGEVKVVEVRAGDCVCQLVDGAPWEPAGAGAWPGHVTNLVVGDTSLKLGLVNPDGEAVQQERIAPAVRELLLQTEQNKKRFPTDGPPAEADWLLEFVERDGILVPVVLRPRKEGIGAARFAVDEDSLEPTLFQIYRAENLLRLTGRAGAAAMPSNLKIEVTRAVPGGAPQTLKGGEALVPGTNLKLRLRMKPGRRGSADAYDVHVFWLDPHYGLFMLFPYEDENGMVGPRLTKDDDKWIDLTNEETLTDQSQGLERFLVIAVPKTATSPQLDLSFLEAEPLELARGLTLRGDVGMKGEDGDVVGLFEELSTGIATRGRTVRRDPNANRLRLRVVSWTTTWGRLRAPLPGPGVVAQVEKTRGGVPADGVPPMWDFGGDLRLMSVDEAPCLLVAGGDGARQVLVDLDAQCPARTSEQLATAVREQTYDAEVVLRFEGRKTTVWYDTGDRGRGPDLVLRDNDGNGRADESWRVTDEGVVHATGLDEDLLTTRHLPFLDETEFGRDRAFARLAPLAARD